MKKIFQSGLTALCLSTAICLADETPAQSEMVQKEETPSFLTMKQEEQSACGIDKLSNEEKTSLQTWIKKYSESKDSSSAHADTTVSTTIKEVCDGGKMIEIADGTKYVIPTISRKTVSTWIAGETVRIAPTKKKNSLMIIHSVSGKSVKVKKFIPDNKSAHSSKSK